MDKNKYLKFFGITLIIIGLIFIISLINITGLVILEKIDKGRVSLFSIVFIVLGIIILASTRESELEKITVFKSRKARTKEESYMLKDPDLFFGSSGELTLEKFKREINQLRSSSGGEELVGIIREAYESRLIEIAESENSERAEIAQEFLKVLDENYSHVDKKNESHRLEKKEREEIKHAFRTYDGRITTEQRTVLKKYNLVFYNSGTSEAKILYPGIGYSVTVSRTPSDYRAGLNIVRDIIDLIEKGRRYKADKKD